MNAVVDQPPAIHDEDVIRVHGRGDALGDDDLGLALNFLVEAPPQIRLRQKVERGEAVVKDIDRRVL